MAKRILNLLALIKPLHFEHVVGSLEDANVNLKVLVIVDIHLA